VLCVGTPTKFHPLYNAIGSSELSKVPTALRVISSATYT